MKKIIIYSYGRTASMKCMHYLAESNNLEIVDLEELDQYDDAYFENINNADNIIVHHHFDWIPSNPQDWKVVHCVRHNILDQVMSTIVAEETNNWRLYENQAVSIEVDYDRLKSTAIDICKWNIFYQKILKNNPWKEKHTVDFFDSVNHTPVLTSVNYADSDHDKGVRDHEHHKSPYTHDDIILNYNELIQQWKTDFKSTQIENDYEYLLNLLKT